MTSVFEAIDIAKRALPHGSDRLRELVVAIGGLESHWGDNFRGNWGAIIAGSSWTGPTFEHEDSQWTPDGVQTYVTTFRLYPTPEAAAADLGLLLQSRYKDAVAAAERGQWYEVSRQLYDGGYYRGTVPPKQAIAAHYARLRQFLVEQGVRTTAHTGGGIGLLLVGTVGFLWWKGRHGRRKHA